MGSKGGAGVWGEMALQNRGPPADGTEPPPPKPHGAVSTSKDQNLTAGRWETELVLHMNKARTRCQEGKAGQIPTENEV